MGIRSLSVVVETKLLDVLMGLFLLTDGDVDDSVPSYSLRSEAGGSAAEVEEVVAVLAERGLVQTISVSNGISWIGITAKGVDVFSKRTNGAIGYDPTRRAPPSASTRPRR